MATSFEHLSEEPRPPWQLMLDDASGVCAELDSFSRAEWLSKRVKFISYELQTRLREISGAREKCHLISDFLFVEKEFKAVQNSDRLDRRESLLLSEVLASRSANPSVLAFLYWFLAAQSGLLLQFVGSKPTRYLKFIDAGTVCFIDVLDSGRILCGQQVLDLLNLQMQLEEISPERFLANYFAALKRAYLRLGDMSSVLLVHNHLMARQPSSLHLLGERALLRRAVGDLHGALGDLKRYFSFQDRQSAPAELVRAHDDLSRLIGCSN